jgi:hypothetical protein
MTIESLLRSTPIIARIARDHLAIPAISAASECVFSVGGDIITKKKGTD